jgi:hypothetical protein
VLFRRLLRHHQQHTAPRFMTKSPFGRPRSKSLPLWVLKESGVQHLPGAIYGSAVAKSACRRHYVPPLWRRLDFDCLWLAGLERSLEERGE